MASIVCWASGHAEVVTSMMKHPRKLRILDLFSGIAGFSLGLDRTGGFETVAFCEIAEFPRRVLRKHWPEVPIYEDVRSLTATQLASDGCAVDVICGGFPCQDISAAGKGAGLAGAQSGLWREYVRIVGEVRPRYVLVENVTELLDRGMGDVLGDLAALGYDAEWHCIPAAAVGAPHVRDRLWIVAYLEGGKPLHLGPRIVQSLSQMGNAVFANTSEVARLHELVKRGICSVTDGVPNRLAWAGQQWPDTEPLICRVDDGLPYRVGRVGGCGNAVVPLIPTLIGRAILEVESLS